MSELRIVPSRQLESSASCNFHQLFSFSRDQRERFFNVDMAPGLEAQPSQFKMTLWRCRDVHDIHHARIEHFPDIRKVLPGIKSLGHLHGH